MFEFKKFLCVCVCVFLLQKEQLLCNKLVLEGTLIINLIRIDLGGYVVFNSNPIKQVASKQWRDKVDFRGDNKRKKISKYKENCVILFSKSRTKIFLFLSIEANVENLVISFVMFFFLFKHFQLKSESEFRILHSVT